MYQQQMLEQRNVMESIKGVCYSCNKPLLFEQEIYGLVLETPRIGLNKLFAKNPKIVLCLECFLVVRKTIYQKVFKNEGVL